MVLCIGLSTAYDVNRTYYVNESAGVIVDEAVNTMQNNSLLTSTAPQIIVVIVIFIMIALPIVMVLLALLYLIKKFGGG